MKEIEENLLGLKERKERQKYKSSTKAFAVTLDIKEKPEGIITPTLHSVSSLDPKGTHVLMPT